MKVIGLLLVVTLFLISSIPLNASAEEIDPSGVLADWKFDESSGGTAYDSAGSNHGTINGATWADGISGTGLKFDAYYDYVTVPYNSALTVTGDFSISAWAKADGWTNYAAHIISGEMTYQYAFHFGEEGTTFAVYATEWDSHLYTTSPG
jgi:hypothetical protein